MNRWEKFLNKGKQVVRSPYTIAFVVPFLICAAICLGNQMYPCGSECVLEMDMFHQYCPFFIEFQDRLQHGGSLFYSFHLGLGSDFASLFAYYLASPFNWLLLLCPSFLVIEFMMVLIWVKIGLCGTAFFAYLNGHFHLRGKDGNYHKISSVPAVIFSIAYALSGYVAAYYWNMMWMDCIFLFPLILLGLERLVKGKSAALYYGTLALSILSNYYISYIICLFLTLYFVILFFEQKKGKIKAVFRFALYSLLAGGTGMVLIIPEAIVLSYSGSSGIEFPEQMEWYFKLQAQLSRLCMGAECHKGNDHWPNLYTGVFSLVLIFLYLLNRRISLGKKISRMLLLALLWVSFANNRLDFIWHGLHFPNSLPARQSFLFSFLLLVMGFEVVRKWKAVRVWQITIAAFGAAGLVGVGYLTGNAEITAPIAYLLTECFLAVYVLFMLIDKNVSARVRSFVRMFAVLTVIGELTANMALTAFSVTSRTAYTRKMKDYDVLLDYAKAEQSGSFYRVEDWERKTKNDATLYGYPSATIFSSLMNINVSHFYQHVGMEGGKNYYCFNGATPLVSAMLSVRYLLVDNEMEESPLRRIVAQSGDYYLYENTFCLPLGFMMDEEAADMDLTVLTKIGNINLMAEELGIEEKLLEQSYAKVEAEAGKTTFTIKEDGYYFATREYSESNTLEEKVSNGRNKIFSKTSHRYTLDLGYCEAGDIVTVSNSNQEKITMTPYRLNQEVLEQAYEILSKQTMRITSLKETRIEGEIDVREAGRIIFTIPAEEGWRLYIDGKETEQTVFAEAFISAHLDEGKHQVKLVYRTPKLGISALISIGSLALSLVCCFAGRKLRLRKKERMLKNEQEAG